jgi:hypothetical protein
VSFHSDNGSSGQGSIVIGFQSSSTKLEHLDLYWHLVLDRHISYSIFIVLPFLLSLEATDSLVQDAVTNEYVKLGTGREIMLTTKGVQWCKENCE